MVLLERFEVEDKLAKTDGYARCCNVVPVRGLLMPKHA
jgi:hypothetical protein